MDTVDADGDNMSPGDADIEKTESWEKEVWAWVNPTGVPLKNAVDVRTLFRSVISRTPLRPAAYQERQSGVPEGAIDTG